MTYIFRKLMSAYKGRVREVAESVIDTNAIRIFSQEIHDSEAAINKGKTNLAHLVAEKLKFQRECGWVESDIKQKEQHLIEAIERTDEDLINDIAGYISEQEELLQTKKQSADRLEGQQKQVEKTLKAATRQITQSRHELRLVQATESAQLASRSINAHEITLEIGKTDLSSSLERIKTNQSKHADYMAAVKEVNLNCENRINKRMGEFAAVEQKKRVEVVLNRVREKMSKKN